MFSRIFLKFVFFLNPQAYSFFRGHNLVKSEDKKKHLHMFSDFFLSKRLHQNTKSKVQNKHLLGNMTPDKWPHIGGRIRMGHMNRAPSSRPKAQPSKPWKPLKGMVPKTWIKTQHPSSFMHHQDINSQCTPPHTPIFPGLMFCGFVQFSLLRQV